MLEQLRNSGLVGAVALMQQAYPTRVAYDAIYLQCEKIMGGEAIGKIGRCHRAMFCEKVLQVLDKGGVYALGKSKLFLRAGGGTFLHELAAMPAEVLVPAMLAKFAQARRVAQRVWMVVGLFSRWWCRARARRERAAAVIQRFRRSAIVFRAYTVWREARLVRIEREREEMAAAERARREALAAAERALRARVAATLLKEVTEAVLAEMAARVAAEGIKLRNRQEADLSAALRVVQRVEEEVRLGVR